MLHTWFQNEHQYMPWWKEMKEGDEAECSWVSFKLIDKDRDRKDVLYELYLFLSYSSRFSKYLAIPKNIQRSAKWKSMQTFRNPIIYLRL